MKHIYTIGEALIDMIDTKHQGLQDAIFYERKFGGASANVAIAASRLGAKVSFLGQIGEDFFGNFIHKTLENENISLQYSYQKGTSTIAWVGLDQDGERSFAFMRGSDGDYKLPQIDLDSNAIVHFGSATAFLGGNLELSYFRLLDLAIEKNATISFDPNYREDLIEDIEAYREKCLTFIKKAHYVKLSLEELELLTKTTIQNQEELIQALLKIREKSNAQCLVTMGAKGTAVFVGEKIEQVKSIKVEQKDSTGAGDAFVGAFLRELAMNDKDLLEKVAVANKVGAIACTKHGAIEALPYLRELEAYD